MKVVAVTNALPAPGEASTNPFFTEQVASQVAAGVEVRVVHADRTGRGQLAYLGLGRRVRDVVSEEKADLVHALYGGVMAWAVARSLRGTPFVVTFCGNDLLGEGETPFTRRGHEALGLYCSRRAAEAAAGIVVMTDSFCDALPDDVDPSRIRVIPTGIDLERFVPEDPAAARARLGWADDRRHVLFPASPTRTEKRFWLARQAFELLQQQSDETLELHCLDGVVRTDVPTWFNASDAVVLTSTHEGSPNAVKEALACNVPVVSVAVGDVAERIRGIEGCALVEPDPDALADALAAALTVGRIEGRHAVEPLALDLTAERIDAFYAEILAAA